METRREKIIKRASRKKKKGTKIWKNEGNYEGQGKVGEVKREWARGGGEGLRGR